MWILEEMVNPNFKEIERKVNVFYYQGPYMHNIRLKLESRDVTRVDI